MFRFVLSAMAVAGILATTLPAFFDPATDRAKASSAVPPAPAPVGCHRYGRWAVHLWLTSPEATPVGRLTVIVLRAPSLVIRPRQSDFPELL